MRLRLDSQKQIIKYLESHTKYEDNCWLYNQWLMDGYGHIKISGQTYGVHNVSAYYYLGFDFSSNLQVNHKLDCPNRNCWNPVHLYIGTQYQNSQDTRALQHYHNQKKTHCPKGHLLTGITSGPSTNFRINRYCKVCRARQKAGYRKAKRNEGK